MRDEIYQLESTPSLMSYEFVSEGPKGQITKLVKYTETGAKDVYNLGFGDKIGDSDDIDDKVVSDNKDSLRILATVAETVYRFTDRYSDAYVYATGSTLARTRLYRISISKFLKEIEEDFWVFGGIDGKIERFNKNIDYAFYLVKRKLF